MAIQTIWLLGTAATTPNWWGVTQIGGSAPTAANSAYGFQPAKTALTTPYYRGRQGATAPTTTAQAASYNAASSGPTPGTGSAATTAGDSFIAGPFYGAFANTAWTFNCNMRASTAGAIGRINMRVWRSANASGAGATQVTANTAGATITLSTTVDQNSSITWSPGALTLTQEYLFFQVEWQETTVGSANGCNALFRIGTASITTADFVQVIAGTLAATQANQTIAAQGKVDIAGTLAKTEVSDTIVATGAPAATGTLALTEASDTLVAAGTNGDVVASGKLVASYSPGGPRADYDNVVGLGFIPTTNVTFNKVGIRSSGTAGFTSVRQVYLFDDAAPGVWLVNAGVDLAGTTAGVFYYVDIPPVTLLAGHLYNLEARTLNDGVHMWADAGPVTLRSDVGSASTAHGGLFAAQTHLIPNQMFYGLDLDYNPALTYTRIDPSNMTGANTPSPYVVTTSSAYPGGYEGWQAFDGNPSTMSHGANTLAVEPWWIKLDLGSSQYGSLYKYQPRDDNATTQWMTWVLEGSNDDSSWTLVDTINNEAQLYNGQGQTYVCDAPGTYRYWRWTVTAANNVPTYPDYASVGSLELWGAAAAAGGPVTGTLAITEAGDTINAAGKVLVSGTLALTEASDTINAAGKVLVGGTLALTEASDTINAAGGPVVGGTLALTEASDTISAAGKVLVGGTLAVTEAGDTISATGKVLVGGTLTATEALDTISAGAKVDVVGTLSITEPADTISANGTVVSGTGPWTPANLGSDLLGWFDGMDAATVTLNGSGVSSWANKGTASFFLADSTGADANRPRYTGSAVTFTTPQVFHVTWPPDITTCDFLIVGKPNDLGDWRTLLHNSDGHNLILIQSGTYNFGAYNEIPPYWQQAGTLTWPVVDGLAYGRVGSGPQVISRDGGTLYSTTIVQPIDKTAVNYVGGYYGATGGNQGWGNINELIFVPYNATDDARQKLEGYAAWKWGLQGLLPSDHPYKSAAPTTGPTGTTGTLNVTEAPDTINAAGSVPYIGVLTQTEAPDTIVASGKVDVSGGLSAMEAPDTISASGTVADVGLPGGQQARVVVMA